RLAGLELPSPTILREFGLALAERLHTIRTTPSASVVAVTRPAAPTHNAPTSTAPAPTTTAPTTPAPAPPLAGNPRPSIGTLAAGPLARGNMAAGTSSPVTSPTASRPASSVTPEATGAGSSADFPAPADPAHATEDSSPAIPPTPFIELRMLDDGSLRELYVMFDPQVWAVALAGAPRALTEKLLGSLPPGSAAELQGTLARGAASDAAAVAAAQHEIEQRLAPLRWRGRRSVRALRRGTRP
ncbi:MAG: FliG C-terminal domain-containing protein, partial [Planctomycetaceae bacterium]